MQRPVGRPAGQGFHYLEVWPWCLLASTPWGARSACPPARRVVTQMTATKTTEQIGAQEAVMQAAAPEVASATGTQAVAQGVAMHVEAARQSRTLSVRELVMARAVEVTPLLMNH